MRSASFRSRALRRRVPVVGAVLAAALAAVLMSAPTAFAGSDLYITVKNDLKNGTSSLYPKVALVTRGGSDCWYDEELGRSKDTNAVSPGKSKKIRTEVKQGGVFTVRGFTADETRRILGSFAPNVLFPYVRQTVSDMISKGGFPPFFLPPVNFDALFERSLQERAAQQAAQAGAAPQQVN